MNCNQLWITGYCMLIALLSGLISAILLYFTRSGKKSPIMKRGCFGCPGKRNILLFFSCLSLLFPGLLSHSVKDSPDYSISENAARSHEHSSAHFTFFWSRDSQFLGEFRHPFAQGHFTSFHGEFTPFLFDIFSIPKLAAF